MIIAFPAETLFDIQQERSPSMGDARIHGKTCSDIGQVRVDVESELDGESQGQLVAAPCAVRVSGVTVGYVSDVYVYAAVFGQFVVWREVQGGSQGVLGHVDVLIIRVT
ncbi:hypothetical protein D3C84_1084740 [compost metagenome]